MSTLGGKGGELLSAGQVQADEHPGQDLQQRKPGDDEGTGWL